MANIAASSQHVVLFGWDPTPGNAIFLWGVIILVVLVGGAVAYFRKKEIGAIRCKRCKHVGPPTMDLTCPKCGSGDWVRVAAPAGASKGRCPSCDTPNPTDALFCKQCGASLDQDHE
jgi:hypothetical protein